MLDILLDRKLALNFRGQPSYEARRLVQLAYAKRKVPGDLGSV
jgi:hypothetical protein